jgi:hypothetical protein
MDIHEITDIILTAMTNINLAREAGSQLEVSPTAPIFAPGSSLDSLSLVALLIDIEDAMFERGIPISLNDEKAVSRKHSPFRDVPSLVSYISEVIPAAK